MELCFNVQLSPLCNKIKLTFTMVKTKKFNLTFLPSAVLSRLVHPYVRGKLSTLGARH